jgi:putative spermidine/putrescine transport system substrate-binding protein
MKKTTVILIIAALIFSLPTAAAEVLEKNWDEIVNEAEGKTVNFYMFGGDRRTNNWVDTFVADNLKEEYNIHVHRVPMGPDDYLNKLLGEKQIGRKTGSIDLLWINGENFKIAKENELLFGPFVDKLPNFNKYIDKDSKSVTHDFGYPTEGYEAPYGKLPYLILPVLLL